MSSESGEALQFEESLRNKKATGCSETRLALDNNKMEAVDVDKTMAEKQMNASEDDEYSEQAQSDDQHDIDDSCKADTQEDYHVKSYGDACQMEQDYAESEEYSELQVVDAAIDADLESVQIHTVEVLNHTNKEFPIIMGKEFEVKHESSVENLKIDCPSFNSELIQAHQDVDTCVEIHKIDDNLQESTISLKKQDSEISQICEQQINQIHSKLEFLQCDEINDSSSTSMLTDTDAMLREIDKIPENDLKSVYSNDQHYQASELIEKPNSAEQKIESLETEPMIDLNDDKFLEEISKSLTNRDITMYDTFSGIDPEESTQNEHKNADNDSKISKDNQQVMTDNKMSLDIENVPDIPSVESISTTADVCESSTISQLKITDNVKLLKIEESKFSKNSDKVSLLTNLIQVNTVEESPSIETNIELRSLIKDESNVTETEALLKPKNTEESSDVINKLQNMNWLKPQSGSESTMARNRKFTLKSLPKKDERAEDYFEGTKKNTNNSRTNANNNAVTTVQTAAPAQPSIWNKNAVEQLFPEAQLANVEDEQMSQAIAESICTAQQESERRKLTRDLKIHILDEQDGDEWGKKVYRNLPDEPSADLANHTKGLVDQFGRVDGYTEKHLFMGEGARRREQEFLKAQSENDNSQSFKKETSLPNKAQQGPANACSQEMQSQSSQAPKKDASLPNKTQQGSANTRSEKDTSKEKPGFNQTSSKGRRRGSATKLETKSDNKNQQSSRNEKQDLKEKPGFGQEASKNSQQQKGQTANQEIKSEAYGQLANHDVKTEGRELIAKQEVKTEPQGQNQQRQASVRFESQSRDKPGFNQGPAKDPYAGLRNQDLTAKPQTTVNKNLDSNKNQQSSNLNKYNQCDNKIQDKDRQQGNPDRHDCNSRSLEPLNSNKDKEQYTKSQHQDYCNRNESQDHSSRIQNQDRSMRNLGQDYSTRNQTQDYSDNRNQTQDRFGRNQTQDHFDRYQNQDHFNRNRNQDCFDRNPNQDRFDRNQSQDQSHRTQPQEPNKNHSNFGRLQENSNKNQNISDRNKVNRANSHDYYNRNQTHDRYNESRNRDQDRYTRNQDFNQEYQDNANKNQDRFHKAHSEGAWNDYESGKSKLSSQNDRYNEPRNRDQDRYHRYQDSANKYQDNANKNQGRPQTAHSEDYWNDYERTKSKLNSQQTSDNKSQQQQQQQSIAAHNQKGYYTQESHNLKSCDQYKNTNLPENRKVDINKQIDISKQTNTNSDNQNIKEILARSSIPSNTDSHSSISSLVSSLVEAKHPLHHSAPNTTISSSTTKEVKKSCKEEIPKAETVVTFSHVHESLTSESRPNVVLAFEGNQNVQRALGLDVNASHAVQSINPQLINAAYANSIMNVNALPFEASSLNAQQGLNCPHLDSTLSSLPLVFPAAPNISSAEAQLRMNEISNLSQDIFRLHSTVASLAKQLATAQADLLVAQAKFSQYQQQIIQTDNAASPTIQAENPSLPANFFTMQCMTPPGFTTATPTIQKPVQADTLQLPKGYVASNVQQDFVVDELHSNAALDQRLLQQYHLYQQLHPATNVQQYNTNVTTASGVSRERILPQSQSQPQLTKGRELRGCRNQFYN